ncbi:PilW family protein [Acidovorax sp.]|uniref:PilW family protein n=1 Tax=Acidovorax sp. TaxID=1872122 RepID=UPI003919E86F
MAGTVPLIVSTRKHRGATLIELLVGITIGLMTIAVAVGALMVSRGVSGTVSDASQIQQQAAYAFRVIGQQLRQAGSIRLDLASNKDDSQPIDPADVVAFETTFDTLTQTVSGLDSPGAGEFKLSVGYQNYTEPSFNSALPVSFFRDCLGAQPSATIVRSQFVLTANELRCAGSDNVSQAVIRNVSGFTVNYLIQTSALTGMPQIRSVNAATAAADWSQVFGVEVCLDLMSDERVDVPAGSTYINCNGNATAFGGRLHMVFRNVYQLRSQGLAG